MFIPPKYKCDDCGRSQEAEWTGQPHWDIPLRWVERENNIRQSIHICEACIIRQSSLCSCSACVKYHWTRMLDQPSEWLTWVDENSIYSIVCPRYGTPKVKLYKNNKLVASFASSQDENSSDEEREILAKHWASEYLEDTMLLLLTY